MKIKNILLIYKKSAYKIYFLEKSSSLFGKQRKFNPAEIERFRAAHSQHYRTLDYVVQMLRDSGMPFDLHCRGRAVDVSPYDLIVSVGGDGTFLESARGAVGQILLGVNSDPQRSVGRFCAARDETFLEMFNEISTGKALIKKFPRIKLMFRNNGRKLNLNVLNDILFCHGNPAAMSRYYLTVEGRREEHRSSGVWVSTGAGSSGATRSAGGKVFPSESLKVQYQPRELYEEFNPNYRLKGGILNLKRPMVIESIMRGGELYIDGAHLKFPFGMGQEAVLTHSTQPARVVCG